MPDKVDFHECLPARGPSVVPASRGGPRSLYSSSEEFVHRRRRRDSGRGDIVREFRSLLDALPVGLLIRQGLTIRYANRKLADVIEDRRELERLAGTRSDFWQGYHLGEPAPAEELQLGNIVGGDRERRP